jgi:N-terminal domain of oxidoreductase
MPDSIVPAWPSCISSFAIRPKGNRNKAASHRACRLDGPRVCLERQRRSCPLGQFQSVELRPVGRGRRSDVWFAPYCCAPPGSARSIIAHCGHGLQIDDRNFRSNSRQETGREAVGQARTRAFPPRRRRDAQAERRRGPRARALHISLDAANRAWMHGATYRAVEPNAVMAGGSIAEVIELKATGFAPGYLVFSDSRVRSRAKPSSSRPPPDIG